jgi:hypothetical protein
MYDGSIRATISLRRNAVKDFIGQYSEKITGTLSCFDRLLFKGYLPLGYSDAMERLIGSQGLLLKDFKRFVTKHSETIKAHAKRIADKAERPFVYLEHNTVRKEDEARRIADRDGITHGLICVFRALEACQSFKLVPGERRPRLINARRKCLCYYFYIIDREFGLMHIRIQSWFPLVVQICINGHEWLARKLDQHGINYIKRDNAFLCVADPRRAQRFADTLVRKNWPRILSAFARKVNPLLKDLLSGMDYYWVVDQAEFATDVMFRSPDALKHLYENLLRHTVLCFSPEDILTFLGRKLHGSFQGEVLTDFKSKRYPGARVKHRMCENWIKMYDKHGCVLRVETVINHPRQFKVRRMGKRQGELVMGWYPMAKGVANLYRYREISLTANHNYLGALARVQAHSPTQQALRTLVRDTRHHGRSYRGFNPANQDDLTLFTAVLRGEHALMGFRNQDVRQLLFPKPTSVAERQRHANRVTRLLKRLHVRGLIAKIPRSRRWRVTRSGQTTLSTALILYHHTPLKQAA